MSYFNPQAGDTHAEALRKKKIAERIAQSAGGSPNTIAGGIAAIGNAVAYRIAAAKAAELEAAGMANANATAIDLIRRSISGGDGVDDDITGSTPAGAKSAGSSGKSASAEAGVGSYDTRSPGGGLPSRAEVAEYVRQSARARGISENTALALVRAEGLNADPREAWQSRVVSKRGGRKVREPSYSPMQLLVGGGGSGFKPGMGNDMIRDTGLDPRDPQNWRAAIDYGLNRAVQGGWGPWYGRLHAGIGKWDGLKGARTIPVGGGSGGGAGGGVGGAPDPRGMTGEQFGDLSSRMGRGDFAAVDPVKSLFPAAPAPGPAPMAPGPRIDPMAMGGMPAPAGTAPRPPAIGPGGVNPNPADMQKRFFAPPHGFPPLNYPNPGNTPMPGELMPPAPFAAPHGPPGRAPAGFPPFNQPHGPPTRGGIGMPPFDQPHGPPTRGAVGGIDPNVPTPTSRPAGSGGPSPMISNVPQRPRVTARGMLDVNDAPLPGTMPYRGGSGGGQGAPIGGGRFNPFGMFGNRAGGQPSPAAGMSPGAIPAGMTGGGGGGLDMEVFELLGNPYLQPGQKMVLEQIAEKQLKSVFGPRWRPLRAEERTQYGLGDDQTPFMINDETGEVKPISPKLVDIDIDNKPGANLTPGWRKIDEAFAEEWLKWGTGGAADAQKRLDQLNEALAILESGEDVTGKVGLLPDIMKPFFNERGTIARENVEEVVQRNLREVLGAQFTEKEGERLIQRAFNDLLPPPENAKRVRRLIAQISAAAAAKDAMVKHFSKHGTLMGYEGPTTASYEGQLSSLANEWERADAKGGVDYKTQTAARPRVGDVVDGYRFNGGNPNDKSSWEKVR